MFFLSDVFCCFFPLFSIYFFSLPPSLLLRGIEWIGQKSLVSYAHSSLNSSGHVKNEIASIELQTGMCYSTL